MNVRSMLLTAVVLTTTCAAFGQERERNATQPQSAAREQTLLAELADGMRELIEAVVPEIALPAVELKLPTLDVDGR